MGTVFTWIKNLLRPSGPDAPDKASLEPLSTKADNPLHALETHDRALAQPSTGKAGPHPPQPDSAERSREHGLRGGAGGTDGAAGGTRAPRHATRYIETSLGVLSYAELAPNLARNVLVLERRIEDGEFSQTVLDDVLLLKFHRLICGDLVPQLAGWRRINVTVSLHAPPEFFRLPALARDYGLDLQARLASLPTKPDELWLETLAFSEGRLLSIHPFADFNGRVTRVWLREVLRRLNLPPVRLVPVEESAVTEYLEALQAADRDDWRPLMDIWKRRIEEAQP